MNLYICAAEVGPTALYIPVAAENRERAYELARAHWMWPCICDFWSALMVQPDINGPERVIGEQPGDEKWRFLARRIAGGEPIRVSLVGLRHGSEIRKECIDIHDALTQAGGWMPYEEVVGYAVPLRIEDAAGEVLVDEPLMERLMAENWGR